MRNLSDNLGGLDSSDGRPPHDISVFEEIHSAILVFVPYFLLATMRDSHVYGERLGALIRTICGALADQLENLECIS